ncbi:MAG: biotin--[acetyl-CoA-carboxylase] ligase [Lentisphaerae bacterium]|nr:biotin--[acetyl-CoA-carboxylase] ligase [Lentisphaerota bacterium]
MQQEPTVVDEGGLHGGRLLVFDALDSTNRWALDHIDSVRNGDVIRAIRQTAGRGRFDRQWGSPGDRGLTLSVILDTRPLPADAVTLIPLSAALAVADTLHDCGIEAQLKWPNDVLVANRKIAGILAERDNRTHMLALGIGLNVNLSADDFAGTDFPHPPTSMGLQTDAHFDVDEVRSTLQSHIEHRLDQLRGGNASALLTAWNARDSLSGKTVTVRTAKEDITGTYAGTQADGRMAVVDATGATRQFWSGDVSIASA